MIHYSFSISNPSSSSTSSHSPFQFVKPRRFSNYFGRSCPVIRCDAVDSSSSSSKVAVESSSSSSFPVSKVSKVMESQEISSKAGPYPGGMGPYTGRDPTVKKPGWLRQRAPQGEKFQEVKDSLSRLKLNTVCEEAQCPNIGEVFLSLSLSLSLSLLEHRKGCYC